MKHASCLILQRVSINGVYLRNVFELNLNSSSVGSVCPNYRIMTQNLPYDMSGSKQAHHSKSINDCPYFAERECSLIIFNCKSVIWIVYDINSSVPVLLVGLCCKSKLSVENWDNKSNYPTTTMWCWNAPLKCVWLTAVVMSGFKNLALRIFGRDAGQASCQPFPVVFPRHSCLCSGIRSSAYSSFSALSAVWMLIWSV